MRSMTTCPSSRRANGPANEPASEAAMPREDGEQGYIAVVVTSAGSERSPNSGPLTGTSLAECTGRLNLFNELTLDKLFGPCDGLIEPRAACLPFAFLGPLKDSSDSAA